MSKLHGILFPNKVFDRHGRRLKPTKGGRYLGKRIEWDKDKDVHKCIIDLHSRSKGQSEASKFVEQLDQEINSWQGT